MEYIFAGGHTEKDCWCNPRQCHGDADGADVARLFTGKREHDLEIVDHQVEDDVDID